MLLIYFICRFGMKLKFKKRSAFLFIIALILLVFGYAYFVEPNTIKAEQLDLKVGCSDKTDNNLNFAQISDLHFTNDTTSKTISEIYDNIRIIKPFAVFITGDLISDKNGIQKAIELINRISSEYPTYIVFGNWDYWSLDFDIKDFAMSLENSGAKVLTNKNIKIEVNDNIYYIMGVKDPYTSGENTEDVDKALYGVDFGIKSCKILLAHSPNVIKYAKNRGIDLILVGHTHGGQVFIPYFSDNFIPSRRAAGRGFVKGLYSINGDRMYVNRGIGTSIIPLRFMSPPEITNIKIR